MKPEDILSAIADGTIKVKSLEECAKAELHVCSGEATGIKGEQESTCSECERPVFFCQSFPADGQQPRKVCVQCALTLARGEDSLSA